MNRKAVSGALPCQRRAFSVPEDVCYLNCAYMSPLPRVSEEAGIRGIRQKCGPMAIHPPDFFTESDRVRRRFARLVGSKEPERVAIIPSVSYAVAVAARNLPLRRGQNIVIIHEQFPSNVYAWQRKSTEVGADLKTVIPPEGTSRGSGWNERLLAAINDDTAIVSIPHVHWADGTVFDIVAVGRRAREVGAALVVDGSQSVGAMPFNVQEVQPDALIVAGYKWLLGPYSLGAAYFSPRFDNGVPLEETWIGRQGSEAFQNLMDYQNAYQPGAARYDVGERSNFILVPMLSASLGLILEWTPERIEAYCQGLSSILAQSAVSLGFSLERDWQSSHLLGLRMPEGLELGVLKAELDARQIFVSLRGSALRVSPNVYNDEGDIGVLLEALAAAV